MDGSYSVPPRPCRKVMWVTAHSIQAVPFLRSESARCPFGGVFCRTLAHLPCSSTFSTGVDGPGAPAIGCTLSRGPLRPQRGRIYLLLGILRAAGSPSHPPGRMSFAAGDGGPSNDKALHRIFALVAVAHIVRIAQVWGVQVAGTGIAMSVSWGALIVSATLAVWGFHAVASAARLRAHGVSHPSLPIRAANPQSSISAPGCPAWRTHVLRKLTYLSAVLALMILLVPPLPAQQPTCILQAVEKKLDGRARTSFLEKCQVEVQARCETLADQRRLEEPNRKLFVGNCTTTYYGVR
jgi:hypothetical protein